MLNKRELRESVKRGYKSSSKRLLIEESEVVIESVEDMDIFRNASIVMLYHPLPDEVDTRNLIIKYSSEKVVTLPTIDGDNIVMKQFISQSDLTPGESYSIPEPSGDIFIGEPDIIIIPGVAFDSNCNRVGRGAGYYDRFLKQYPNSIKIGLAFTHQYVDYAPTELHDIPMDIVISPKGVITKEDRDKS